MSNSNNIVDSAAIYIDESKDIICIKIKINIPYKSYSGTVTTESTLRFFFPQGHCGEDAVTLCAETHKECEILKRMVFTRVDKNTVWMLLPEDKGFYIEYNM